jgi:hypothetical protein
MEVIRVEKFGRFTVVEVKEVYIVKDKEKKITGIGISRQSDDDRYDEEKAKNIATGRAIKAVEKKQKSQKINSIFMG